jgi:hypothetical protein
MQTPQHSKHCHLHGLIDGTCRPCLDRNFVRKTTSTVRQLVKMTDLDETTLHQKTLDTAANATVTQWKTALTPSLRLLAASEQGRQTGKLELRPRPHPRLAIMLWNYGHIHSIILSARTTTSIVRQSMEKTEAFSRGA